MTPLSAVFVWNKNRKESTKLCQACTLYCMRPSFVLCQITWVSAQWERLKHTLCNLLSQIASQVEMISCCLSCNRYIMLHFCRIIFLYCIISETKWFYLHNIWFNKKKELISSAYLTDHWHVKIQTYVTLNYVYWYNTYNCFKVFCVAYTLYRYR